MEAAGRDSRLSKARLVYDELDYTLCDCWIAHVGDECTPLVVMDILRFRRIEVRYMESNGRYTTPDHHTSHIILLHLENSMDYCNALEIIHTYGLFCLLFHSRTFFFRFSFSSFVLPYALVCLPSSSCLVSLHAFHHHPSHCPQRLTIAFHLFLYINSSIRSSPTFRAYHPPFF